MFYNFQLIDYRYFIIQSPSLMFCVEFPFYYQFLIYMVLLYIHLIIIYNKILKSKDDLYIMYLIPYHLVIKHLHLS